MKRKRIMSTTAVLFALTLLAMSLFRVSAVPLSPYIMVLPEKTLNSTLTPGSTYTITVYTDYAADSDIWAWQFALTFNPAVLRGTGVANGDLITTAKNPNAIFIPGTFNNTAGKLSLTAAYFDYTSPPPPTTNGPGTFASVSFEVIGYGASNITLGDRETKLIGAIGSATYDIIDGFVMFENIGHGFFSNKLAGDADGDADVDYSDFVVLAGAYGSTLGQPAYKRNADFDIDGDVDYSDFVALAGNYGKSI